MQLSIFEAVNPLCSLVVTGNVQWVIGPAGIAFCNWYWYRYCIFYYFFIFSHYQFLVNKDFQCFSFLVTQYFRLYLRDDTDINLCLHVICLKAIQ